MEHREVQQLADAFVTDQLPVDTAAAVVAHLERCPMCRAEVDGLRRLRAATRTAFERAPELAPRPDFAASLASRLRAEAAPRPTLIGRRRWLAVAASAIVSVGAGWGWREWSLARLRDLARLAVGDHRWCALTFKLAERPISLNEAGRRFGEAAAYARLETLEPSSAVLSGGALQIVERHSCVFEGQRFTHLVMRYKGEAVSLLIADDRSHGPWGPGDSPAPLPATDGFQVATFRGARRAVFVVSSLAAADVEDVARAMADPVLQALSEA